MRTLLLVLPAEGLAKNAATVVGLMSNVDINAADLGLLPGASDALRELVYSRGEHDGLTLEEVEAHASSLEATGPAIVATFKWLDCVFSLLDVER